MDEILEQMREKAGRLLSDHRVGYDELRVFATPRRLILVAEVAAEQLPSVQETLGPAKRISYDALGKPTAAAVGFSRSQGIDPGDLQIRSTERGEYVCAVKSEPGGSSAGVLALLIPQWLSSLVFPRSMRWNSSGVSFVRPVRWVAALLGGKRIPFAFAGITSGRLSRGHPILSPGSFPVNSREQYFKELKNRFVDWDPELRYEKIRRAVFSSARGRGGEVPDDEDLLRQAVHSTEWPTAIWGEFDPVFLSLPSEVIVCVMREHQGYFPVRSRGKLLPFFVLVSDGAKSPRTIREGNERVLRARLVDAVFYFEEDKKVKLSDRVEALKAVGFLPRLGSMYDKTQRLVALVRGLAELIDPSLKGDVQRAALLSKADLLSGMVREFPALQGIMGREYARRCNESETAARAIGEQYLPRSSGDHLPETLAGKILAISDKIDTIVGCYALGWIPTGSEDPYALRRQGLGILRIAIEGGVSLSISTLVRSAIDLFDPKILQSRGDLQQKVERAFVEWMRSYERTQVPPIPSDLTEVVLATGIDDPKMAQQRILALVVFRQMEGFQPLIVAFKRAARILPPGFAAPVDTALLEQEAEIKLYELLLRIEEQCEIRWTEGAYQEYLQLLADLRVGIDLFFEQVLVMAKEPRVQANRLGLLQRVVFLFDRFGDFRKVLETG